MGFLEEQRKTALEKFNGNVEFAPADLLSSESSSPVPDFVPSKIESTLISQPVEICQIVSPKIEIHSKIQLKKLRLLSSRSELMKQQESSFSDADVDVGDLYKFHYFMNHLLPNY